jgi:uncharacterized protein (TIGR03000 family)
MFRQVLTRFGAPAMVAAVFAMAGPAWAQHHGGGGHAGGFHGGSPHVGGFHTGSRHLGGFHSDGFHRGSFDGGRFHRGGFYPGYYYGYYSPYGYDSYYGYYPPYSDSPSYDLGYGSDSNLAYPDSYGGVAPSYSGGYLTLEPPSTVSPNAASAQADSTAHVTVRVPANAELWVDGSKTTSTGSVREFQSPPLTPGQYTYEFRAHWTENGRDITQTRKVAVSPGAHVAVMFQIDPGQTQTVGAANAG